MLITAVSGSLDRLSAEKDTPVRYDNTYKSMYAQGPVAGGKIDLATAAYVDGLTPDAHD